MPDSYRRGDGVPAGAGTLAFALLVGPLCRITIPFISLGDGCRRIPTRR